MSVAAVAAAALAARYARREKICLWRGMTARRKKIRSEGVERTGEENRCLPELADIKPLIAFVLERYA